MRPMIIHADGTDCHHEGPPQATMLDGAPLCAAGLPVTHVRFNGTTMTLDEARVAFGQMADAIAKAIAPVAAAVNRLAHTFAKAAQSSPALRALAAATAELEGEQ